jgi:hypothetical protein
MTVGERSGDTVLSWNGAVAWELENPGLEEYVVFSVLVADSHHPEVETELVPGIEWRTLDYIFPLGANAFDWFSAPIAVSYRRVTWEPGAQLVLGPDEAPMLSFIWLESGQLDPAPPGRRCGGSDHRHAPVGAFRCASKKATMRRRASVAEAST